VSVHPYCTEHDQPLDWCDHDPQPIDVMAELDHDALLELLRHLIKMRSVHKAVGYDVRYETAQIEQCRKHIRECEQRDV
jgi:hypothetical protein